MWQFLALAAGQVEGQGLSVGEADELWQWMQSKG